jgi:hypothetical protein
MMKLIVDDYYLAYTDGIREQQIHLEQPAVLSDVLSNAHIQVWEIPTVMLNGQICADLSTLVTDQDEVQVSGGRTA